MAILIDAPYTLYVMISTWARYPLISKAISFATSYELAQFKDPVFVEYWRETIEAINSAIMIDLVSGNSLRF